MNERFFPASVRIVGDTGLTDTQVVLAINALLSSRHELLRTMERIISSAEMPEDDAGDLFTLIRLLDSMTTNVYQLQPLDPAQFVVAKVLPVKMPAKSPPGFSVTSQKAGYHKRECGDPWCSEPEQGTLFVNGANLGPAQRNPDGSVEAGPHIQEKQRKQRAPRKRTRKPAAP